ncbi:murein tripeptide ABC transporter/oligopeptide ABC transporter ATP binding subunit OppF [Rhodovastum atsumiense]|uniref:ATP-binding cassette domain-containing protein n=1 Tax=Rhodovastum atsumiense TaxID=504468 RepID=A0A5M6IQV0_9PROT|nr:oligopeptide/dipeptide ABC transporter ATP-binding protein [Rhodovastum atsumiense]KAA5610663.1 ATP-binding cassette domain-containing protein [Rhodovastum atsumiense]CAH2603344.1 murein tripeptide ABC transporter/oligopeptide ABC transporter ATP binding subunit OppF [Rhodovastum atsumiense]
MSLISVRDLRVSFATPQGRLQAVDDVSFDVAPGETLGLVGESGCGKSTLSKALLRLVPVTSGRIEIEGEDIVPFGPRALRRIRPKVQMVFQDPYGSLNPRHRVGTLIGQPLSVAGWGRRQIRDRVAELLEQVGLPRDAAERYPHEFSGGQRQRVVIARALALSPKLVICDEPVSALDVSVRAQVINLFKDLQDRLGVAYLFISHDLSVVENVSDRLIVMYLGRIIESGRAAEIWRRPAHPYTQALLAAAPVPDPKLARQRRRLVLQGELPSPLNPPSGCAFRTRCPQARPRCAADRPPLRALGGAQRVACHFDLADAAPAPVPSDESACV